MNRALLAHAAKHLLLVKLDDPKIGMGPLLGHLYTIRFLLGCKLIDGLDLMIFKMISTYIVHRGTVW